MPNPTTSVVFERLSSPLSSSPFDKALDSRDRIVLGWVKAINKFVPPMVPQATSTRVTEVEAMYAAVFPGHGEFGPGGGPRI